MEITGQERIDVPQQQVWEALNDPAILRQCITGCESVDRISDTEFRLAITAAIGPVKARFSGKLLLADVVAPTSYTLSFEGSGGAAGFGKGSAQVRLEPQDGGTLLHYEAKASVGGKLAQVGSRLIDGVARKMAEDFFARFKATVSTPAATEPAAPEAMPAAMPAAVAATPATSGRLPLWALLLVAVAAGALALYFLR